MREIPFENEFDVAPNLFTAFGYLENDDEEQKALDTAARTLKRGGKFVLDVINRDRVVRNYRPNHWAKLSDSSIVLTEAEFDHTTGRNSEEKTRINAEKG